MVDKAITEDVSKDVKSIRKAVYALSNNQFILYLLQP